MKIDVVTIFPEMYNDFLNTSIIKRAINNNFVDIKIHNLRDYSKNKHNKVDDTPYGGGVGMLMAFPPFYRCLKEIKTDKSKVILLTPQGKLLKQDKVYKIAENFEHIILLSGHYEGIDARIENFIDYEISIGDYVLTGGELPSMVLIDAITRLIPGVILEESHRTDTLSDNRLKYPQYTKPESYQGYDVPKVLLSGHHKKIEEYREYMKLKNTIKKRPDLIEKYPLNEKEIKILNKYNK